MRNLKITFTDEESYENFQKLMRGEFVEDWELTTEELLELEKDLNEL